MTMTEQMAAGICAHILETPITTVERCAVGMCNYVYQVTCGDQKYIFRCSTRLDAYRETSFWLEKLAAADIPCPRVLAVGTAEGYAYLLLTYLEGQDLGLVYSQLSKEQKRVAAKTIVDIQKRVAAIPVDLPENWSWYSFLYDLLDTAQVRIALNGYFSPEKTEQLREQMRSLDDYFSNLRPLAYLDDISNKNLLFYQGRISGVIDVDTIGVGDRLTYVALTHVALRFQGFDTDYVDCILEEMSLTPTGKRAFLFYSLLYCVDFMGERGMTFAGKRVEVDQTAIDRLNGIYDELWQAWKSMAL